MVSKVWLQTTVQQKRELRGLATTLVNDVIASELQKHRVVAEDLNEREAYLIVKDARRQLRTLTGRFQKSGYPSN